MTKGHQQSEKQTYTDEHGNKFEMIVVKHFSFEEKQYVLAREQIEHHHGEDCNCHSDHHDHGQAESSGDDGLYVFEWIAGNDDGALISVSEEILAALEPIFEAM
ncbi:DUF1292 domain-containing protein [Acetobacterium tundrae]|uniref:DUF1292 domain-containing protein n=1 Tax=Acetobacterium tundrae TaxID=132932 RepID=A0ABR6WM92_9FIRM|nr:DUF1292 domain-containing protein [Acetobacterium tundrae]MBC3797551.1 DUF1292 domain-containing protein [Acetobacterium tundrae]